MPIKGINLTPAKPKSNIRKWETLRDTSKTSTGETGTIFKIQLNQNEIAKGAGLSQQKISYIIKRDRTPSIEDTIKLEKATGICREAWVFPDRCWNPYMPFAESRYCGGCPKKGIRFSMIKEQAFRFAEKFPDRKGLTAALEVIQIYENWPDSVWCGFSQITPEGLEFIVGFEDGVYKPEPLIPNKKFKHVIEKLKSGQPILSPFMGQHHTRLNHFTSIAKRYHSKMLKSSYMFPFKDLVLSIFSFDFSMILYDDDIQAEMDLVRGLCERVTLL